MTRTTHSFSEVHMIGLQSGWSRLPQEIEADVAASRRAAPGGLGLRCTLCLKLADALIGAGRWFEARALGGIAARRPA